MAQEVVQAAKIIEQIPVNDSYKDKKVHQYSMVVVLTK